MIPRIEKTNKLTMNNRNKFTNRNTITERNEKVESGVFRINKAECATDGYKPGIVYCFNGKLHSPLCVRCEHQDECEKII